jgi:type VI secretion system secreted protein Hcp
MKDIYVDFLTGIIKGDSRDSKHKDTVEVTSFSHMIHQPKSATSSSSGGHTAERVEFGDLIFTKDIDLASPPLMAATCSGTLIKEIKVYFYRAYGGATAAGTQSRVCYYTLVLKNTIVSSVTTTIGAEGLPVETFTLKPSSMSWKYVEHKPDGSSQANIERQWDLQKNTPTLGN